MQVVILCGGLGTRMREETEFRPKPMVPIGQRPILWHVMKYYAMAGHTDFVLALGYKGEVVKDYFYSTEDIHSIAAGFVGTISIDAAEPGDPGFYVTAQTDAITVNPSAPVDGDGDTWSEIDYDLAFPTATQCLNYSIWNSSPWYTWGNQYYDLQPDGAYPIWYNALCRGDYSEAFARIVFTVPEDGTICDPGQGGISTDGGTSWTPFVVPPVCGNNTVEAGEQCDPPSPLDAPCAANQVCNGCSATCQNTTFTSCDGVNPNYTGSINYSEASLSPAIAKPECIQTMTGGLTLTGAWSSDPAIRFPNLRSVGGSLTINGWPTGKALLPALAEAPTISIGTSVSATEIILPSLESAANNVPISIFFPATSDVALVVPSYERGLLTIPAGATGASIELGPIASLVDVSNRGIDTSLSLPYAVDHVNSLYAYAGSLHVTAPGLATLGTLYLPAGVTVTGLATVNRLGPGVHDLLGNAALPAVTEVIHTHNTFSRMRWAPETVSMPMLESITGYETEVLPPSNGILVLPASLTTVTGRFWTSGAGLTSFTARGLESVGSLMVVFSGLTSISMPSLDTVTTLFEFRHNASLAPTIINALLAQLSATPTTVTICSNGGVAPTCP